MNEHTEEQTRRNKRRKTKNTTAPSWESTRHFKSKDEVDKSRAPTAPENKISKGKKTSEKGNTIIFQQPDDQIKLPNTKISKKRTSKNLRKRTRQDLESYAGKLEKFENLKAEVAAMASKLVSNPEEKVGLLSQLRKMAQQAHGKSAALIILTESQLYKDIAPAYRIRSITEKEAEVKVSKEIARLRTFEQSLAKYYQAFVRSCVSAVGWRSGKGAKTEVAKDMMIKRNAACKSLSELIAALPHFNEAETVANAVCSLTQDREEDIRKQSSKALTQVLENAHRSSGQTLQICIQISKQLANLASSKARVVPEEVIVPLINIRFVKFPLLPPSKKSKNEPKKAKRFIKKRRRKPEKEIEGVDEDEIEKDLQEGYAEASTAEIFNSKKQLLDHVCHAYFNVIKVAADSVTPKSDEVNVSKNRTRKPPPALFVVLKGLRHMATFINTSVMESILDALVILVEDGNLPMLVRFRCLSGCYAVLGVHSKAQKADPDSFVRDAQSIDAALYKELSALYGPGTSLKDEEQVTIEAIETIITAGAYREIPAIRRAALSRKLACLCAGLAPTHACTIGLLRAAQTLLAPSLVSPIFKQAANKVDKSDGIDAGVVERYDMKVEDPEITGAERSAAWELSCLHDHFHPTVRQLATKCAMGFCGARLPFTRDNIAIATMQHATAEGGFYPMPQATPTQGIKGRKSSYNARSSNVLKSVLGEEKAMNFLKGDDCIPMDFFISGWKLAQSETNVR